MKICRAPANPRCDRFMLCRCSASLAPALILHNDVHLDLPNLSAPLSSFLVVVMLWCILFIATISSKQSTRLLVKQKRHICRRHGTHVRAPEQRRPCYASLLVRMLRCQSGSMKTLASVPERPPSDPWPSVPNPGTWDGRASRYTMPQLYVCADARVSLASRLTSSLPSTIPSGSPLHNVRLGNELARAQGRPVQPPRRRNRAQWRRV